MHFVLVHGWGFHAGIWADVVTHLGPVEVTLVDLGFVSGGPKGKNEWPQDSIAIGHSLGLLWLLQQGRSFKGVVSVQGFDCFCCHVPQSRVAALKRGLERDAGATLQAFWRSCGAAGFALPEALNVSRHSADAMAGRSSTVPCAAGGAAEPRRQPLMSAPSR